MTYSLLKSVSVSVSDDASVSDDVSVSHGSFTTMLTHSIRFAAFATLGYMQNGPDTEIVLDLGGPCTGEVRAAAFGKVALDCHTTVVDTEQVSEKI